MPWLVAIAILGLGGILLGRTKTGDTKRDPNPKTDAAGRVYYDVYKFDGQNWQLFGRQYLGGQ